MRTSSQGNAEEFGAMGQHAVSRTVLVGVWKNAERNAGSGDLHWEVSERNRSSIGK